MGWRGAATPVARGRIRLDGTRCREVKLEFSFDSNKYLHFFPEGVVRRNLTCCLFQVYESKIKENMVSFDFTDIF